MRTRSRCLRRPCRFGSRVARRQRRARRLGAALWRAGEGRLRLPRRRASTIRVSSHFEGEVLELRLVPFRPSILRGGELWWCTGLLCPLHCGPPLTRSPLPPGSTAGTGKSRAGHFCQGLGGSSMPACPDGHAGASPLRETSTSTARDRSPPRGRRGAPRRRRLPVLHGVLVTIASWSLLLCCAGLSAGAEPETDPARHTPRAGDISVTAGTFHGALQKAASAWGLTSGEGVSPGLQPDPVWEGGIDRLGVLGCHMGRAGGNCSSAGNCLRPPSADQAELCLSHGSMERTNTGKWAANHSKGVYTCACCNASLFLSRDKFDSARGHATFHKSVSPPLSSPEYSALSARRRPSSPPSTRSCVPHARFWEAGPERGGVQASRRDVVAAPGRHGHPLRELWRPPRYSHPGIRLF